MIAAPQGRWFARIETGDDGWEDEPTYMEVIAWDSEGHALVIDFTGGCLRRASGVDGFDRLTTALEKDSLGGASDAMGEEEDDDEEAA